MRAVAYYRKSNEDRTKDEKANDEDGDSVKQQKDWAATLDVTIVKSFDDQAISGNDTLRRTDFANMIAFCEDQYRKGTPIDAVVCWKANRFSRADNVETMAFVHRLREVGCSKMVTSEKTIDFYNSQDRMVFGLIQEASDHTYVTNCSTDTKRGKAKRAKEGFWNGGPPPLGYSIFGPEKKRMLVVVPEHAEQVQLIFKLYLDGHGLRAIVDELVRREIKSRDWTIQTISAILKNPAYLGNIVHRKRSEGKSIGSVRIMSKRTNRPLKRINHPKESWIVTKNAHEGIISLEVFDAVQARMATNKKATSPNKAFILSGLLQCGNCGAPMHGRTFNSNRRYSCSSYSQKGKERSGCSNNSILETALFDAVVKKLNVEFDPVRLRGHLVAQIQPEPVADNRLADLDAKIAKATERLADLDDAVFTKLSALIVKLEGERELIVKEMAAKQTMGTGEEQVERSLKMAHDFRRALKQGDSGIAKELLGKMVDHIELWFDVTTRKVRKISRFARGVIYIPDLSGVRGVVLQACDVGTSEKQAIYAARRANVQKLRNEGKCIKSIAAELNVAERTIRNDLAKCP